MVNKDIFIWTDLDELSEDEFKKAARDGGWTVFSEDAIKSFVLDLDALIEKGQSGSITEEQALSIQKGIRDMSNLTRKVVIRSDGVKTTKWVKTGAAPEGADKKRDHRSIVLVHHPMYTDSDYMYHRNQGFTDSEIKKIWDKEYSEGGHAIHHKRVITSAPVSGAGTNRAIMLEMMVTDHKFKADAIKNLKDSELAYIEKYARERVNLKSGAIKSKQDLRDWVAGVKMEIKAREEKKATSNPSSDSGEKPTFEQAWERHQHQVKTQRMGKSASLKAIEKKYGSYIAAMVKDKHEGSVKKVERKYSSNS